jgi:hypothetical protein
LFVETSTVLQFDDVHSSEGIKVSVYNIVLRYEHGNEEGKEQDVEYEYKQCDEYGTLLCVQIEFLLTVQTIEDVLEHLKEGRLLFL